MKILLDECVPLDFRLSFPNHEVHTAQWAGFKGKKNGELLLMAETAGYQAFLTVDQGIPHQTSPTGRKLAILIMRSSTNQIDDLLPLVESVRQVLETITDGEVIVVSK